MHQQKCLSYAAGNNEGGYGIYKGKGDMKSWSPEQTQTSLHDMLGLEVDRSHVVSQSNIDGKMLFSYAMEGNTSVLVNSIILIKFNMTHPR